jgi:superfamily II DNA/RNA helicase
MIRLFPRHWICVNSWFSGWIKGMSFSHFGVPPGVVRGTHAMGFVERTPIQLRAFPVVLAGKDLIGTAQTGHVRVTAIKFL